MPSIKSLQTRPDLKWTKMVSQESFNTTRCEPMLLSTGLMTSSATEGSLMHTMMTWTRAVWTWTRAVWTITIQSFWSRQVTHQVQQTSQEWTRSHMSRLLCLWENAWTTTTVNMRCILANQMAFLSFFAWRPSLIKNVWTRLRFNIT